MDPRQLEALAKRLAENANDTDALNTAYAHGQTDPRGYAVFLEKTGAGALDPATGAHWFCEAATVWTASLSDVHRAERALVKAVDRDPLHAGATARLVELYREKENIKGVVALHQRRTKIIEKDLADRPDLGLALAEIYAEIARIFTDELGQPEKAISSYQKAAELNPRDAYSIYQARELLKSVGRLKEALPLFQAEIDLVTEDPTRQVALYADEANVCRELGDIEGLKRSLRGARSVDASDDPSLKQQFGAVVLEQIQAGVKVSDDDVTEAEDLFISLAETYDGAYGHSYAVCALGLNPRNDRAAQLAMYYAAQIGQSHQTAPTIASYLAANPQGAVAEDARQMVAAALQAGGGDDLIQALTPVDEAPAEVKAEAFALIGRSLLSQGRKPDSIHYFKKVVLSAPAHEEAVSFLSEQYRGRDERALRDLLQAATRTTDIDPAFRQSWLTELAQVCEGRLGDVDGAIEARRQLVLMDPSNDEAADLLETTLATAAQWDELADLIERRAQLGGDPQLQIDRELQAADIHLTKRKDRRAAAEALSRAARIEPDEEERAFSAVDLFVDVGSPDAAIALLIGLLASMLGEEVRANYNEKLAGLLENEGRLSDAGGAYAEAASLGKSIELWAEAERCFAGVEAWTEAAKSIAERADLVSDEREKSKLCEVRAEYLERLGDREGVLDALKEALEFDVRNLSVSLKLQTVYEQNNQFGELVALLLARALLLADGEQRVALRKQAGFLLRDQLIDEEGMRDALALVLDDQEDAETLLVLADDAEKREESELTIGYLRRLLEVVETSKRTEVALRLARLLEEAGDEEGALEQYEMVLVNHRERVEVLSAVAHLRRVLGNANGASEAYAQLVEVTEGDQKFAAARIWAEILTELGQAEAALKAYSIVLSIDAEDFEVVELARDLAEESGHFEEYVKYQQELVDLEGDEDESSLMVRKLAEVYELKLSRPKDAMKVLTPFVKNANVECREMFERLGASLGIELEVAKLVFKWMKEVPAGPERMQALSSAYEQFVTHKADQLAIEAGLELVGARGAEESVAESLEVVGIRAKSLDALRMAFRVLGKELSGPARAEEMVRQAEILHQAGAEIEDAILHGEQSLTSVGPDDAEPLLGRLAKIAGEGEPAVSVYERQVARCKSASERLAALCRGAEVAHEHGVTSRVGQFLELAIQTAGHGEGLDDLRSRVGEMDLVAGRTILREALCRTLSEGGKNARDGGKSRAEYLAHAAAIAYDDLRDAKLAFSLMTQALISQASEEYLEQLVEMGKSEKNLKKAADAIGVALDHVSDSPMVRLLLKQRFELFAGPLAQEIEATEDLKRLYELSPTESDISDQLELRYESANDHRGLVKLYEDQILRGRDKKERAELARKVALLWQDILEEPREAADAWRRVLRMNSGDNEAKEGLEKAKAGMRRVSAKQVIESEEQTRLEVEANKEVEQLEAKRRQEELEAKAAELKARHSQPPASFEEEDLVEGEGRSEDDVSTAALVIPVDALPPGDLVSFANGDSQEASHKEPTVPETVVEPDQEGLDAETAAVEPQVQPAISVKKSPKKKKAKKGAKSLPAEPLVTSDASEAEPTPEDAIPEAKTVAEAHRVEPGELPPPPSSLNLSSDLTPPPGLTPPPIELKPPAFGANAPDAVAAAPPPPPVARVAPARISAPPPLPPEAQSNEPSAPDVEEPALVEGDQGAALHGDGESSAPILEDESRSEDVMVDDVVEDFVEEDDDQPGPISLPPPLPEAAKDTSGDPVPVMAPPPSTASSLPPPLPPRGVAPLVGRAPTISLPPPLPPRTSSPPGPIAGLPPLPAPSRVPPPPPLGNRAPPVIAAPSFSSGGPPPPPGASRRPPPPPPARKK